MHEMEWRGKVSTRSLNYSFITIQQLLFFALPFHYPRAQLKFGALQPTPKKTIARKFSTANCTCRSSHVRHAAFEKRRCLPLIKEFE
jgi:hypothetical protein